MTEAQYKAHIVSMLRNGSKYWKPSLEALKRARIRRGVYLCKMCGNTKDNKSMVVDHINPVVPVTGWESFDSFVHNLFCEVDNLQAICKDCHKIKTKNEQDQRKAFKSEDKID